MTPRAFPPQRQAFLHVHAIEALLADVPAFPSQHHQEPVIAESHAGVGQLSDALAQGGEGVLPARVVHRRSRRLHDPTRAPRADAVPAHQVLHGLTLLDGL